MAPETYYAAIQSGQSHADAELHTDADCEALDGAARPLSGSVVGPETHTVHECGSDTDLAEDAAAARDADAEELTELGDGDDVEVCDTVKGDGEVCGRPLPCQYHSD